ncbi:DUF1987 domain-containing protein [Desulfococcaceae bacterium HSG8]|nr:DUF1987 domain-containing protein [Desulfococcaceae bacterium HSG8]
MDNLKINATKCTPEIFSDYENNIFDIRGDSYPEDAKEFYEPVCSWLEEYLGQLEDRKFAVNMELIYFNSSSAKVLTDIFDMLEEANSNENIIINWIYDEDNEDALDIGEEFQEDLESLEFNLVKKE